MLLYKLVYVAVVLLSGVHLPSREIRSSDKFTGREIFPFGDLNDGSIMEGISCFGTESSFPGKADDLMTSFFIGEGSLTLKRVVSASDCCPVETTRLSRINSGSGPSSLPRFSEICRMRYDLLLSLIHI